jgi:hypothetical protein
MTQRERYLALAVGVVVVLLVANVGFKKITTDLAEREAKVEKAQRDLDTLNSSLETGKRISNKIENLEKRSLPRNTPDAQTQYRKWLFQLAEEVGLKNVNCNPINQPIKVVPQGVAVVPGKVPEEAYWIHEFQLTGECRSDKIIDLMAKYYDRDYLHRIKRMALIPTKQSNVVVLDLTSQAITLPKAAEDQSPSLEHSGRLAMSLDQYKSKILSRNPFSPPNNPPKIETGRSHDVTIGKPWSLKLESKDPDGHDVSYELLTDREKLPQGLRMRNGELSWQPAEKTEQELLIKATDDGWPRKSSEIKLVLKAVEAPVEKVEAPPATIDPAKQAYVTGLVDDRSWIRSKAEDTTYEVFPGSEIKIGSIKATVVRINPKEDYLELDTDGSHWTVDMQTSLADAYAKSRVN